MHVEQLERQSEREERTNYQKMLAVLQQDNQQLRQQLIEAPQASQAINSTPLPGSAVTSTAKGLGK